MSEYIQGKLKAWSHNIRQVDNNINGSMLIASTNPATKNGEANAAEIVKRWNAYPDLIKCKEALEEFAMHLETIKLIDSDDKEVYELCRQALKNAGEV